MSGGLTPASKARNLDQMQRDPSDRRHGTPTGWRYGCRCGRCRQAHAADLQRYALRRMRRGEGE